MIEVSGKEITTGKILIKDVFAEDQWYLIPDYQRPYVWGDDEVNNLLTDISEAAETNNKSQYFLGSIVLHSNKVTEGEITFTVHSLLDGQQRLTTLYLLFAVIRDTTDDTKRKDNCSKSIYQEENADDNIPERLRIVFDIRPEVQDFINRFVKEVNGTNDEVGLKQEREKSSDLTVRNLANAILAIKSWFNERESDYMNVFVPFLRSQVLVIYVASGELDDAFRLFTVLNDRGVKLRNSDILKAENLRAVKNSDERKRYATLWEEIEGDFGEDFDEFLSYIRTILVKEKARLSLLKEFNENIYAPKKYEKETKAYIKADPLLHKGKDTFDFIKKYKAHYDVVMSGNNYELEGNHGFDNLMIILNDTAQSDIWIPPLLAYREAFGSYKLPEFLKKLDNKFSGDWIAREMPTTRIEAMNAIISLTEEYKLLHSTDVKKGADKLLSSDAFSFDTAEFFRHLELSDVYGRKYAKYILYKLDYLFGSDSEKRASQKEISVEHILPQNPEDSSQWVNDFTKDQRAALTNRIGNLVLISRKKNSSQGRLDYSVKREKYFKNKIETFANSVRIMKDFPTWTSSDVAQNTAVVVQKLRGYYNS